MIITFFNNSLTFFSKVSRGFRFDMHTQVDIPFSDLPLFGVYFILKEKDSKRN